MMAIVFDLGRPDRVLHLFIYPQFNSPLIWDVSVINIYLILCVAMLYFGIKGKTKLLKIFALISIPAFVLVHSVTAWIFGLMKSQAGWHTAILAPLFIVSALVSGLAAVIIALTLSRRFLDITCNDDTIISLGKYFKALLPILFYFLFCEFLTVGFANEPQKVVVLKELLVGRFAGIFWFDIGFGIIIPFLIIISRFGRPVAGVGIVSVLSFLGVFTERIDIILPSFFNPASLRNLRIPFSYQPTGVEILLPIGLFALGVILFIAATKFIPLCDCEGEQKTMKTLTRKEFLKLAGVGIGAVSGAAKLTSKAQAAVKESEFAQVKSEFIFSTCQMCGGQSGIMCRVVDGKLVKIDPNPYNPNNFSNISTDFFANVEKEGTCICPKGNAGIGTLYDQDRLQKPLRRTNPQKGIDVDPGWKEISWEEA